MKKMTVTAFEKLSAAKTKEALPVEVTSSGKTAYYALASLPTEQQATLPLEDLVDLVLVARNQNRGDSAHVANAADFVKAFFGVVDAPAGATPKPPVTATIDMTKPFWLGDWSGNVKDFVANQIKDLAATKTILLIPYNIPGRDNGNYSAGGLHSAAEYAKWVREIAAGIGDKAAEVILEPDAIGLSVSLYETQRKERYAMLNDAAEVFSKLKNTKVYVDSSIWLGVDKSVEMLAPMKNIDGFSCNVSGYEALQDCVNYAVGIYQKTGLHAVIDTSRNGNGAPHKGMWCNMIDTKIGVAPTYNTGIEGIDAFLWVKVPGESDGLQINGDGQDKSKDRKDVPAAGVFWQEIHDALVTGNWTEFKAKYKV